MSHYEPNHELVVKRNELWKECEPHLEFQLELLKSPIEGQIQALAFVVGLRKMRPTKH